MAGWGILPLKFFQSAYSSGLSNEQSAEKNLGCKIWMPSAMYI
jgi:hypothetical protein